MPRGADLTRLLTGIVMLAVLAMLISETAKPRNWAWMVSREKLVQEATAVADGTSVHGRPIEVDPEAAKLVATPGGAVLAAAQSPPAGPVAPPKLAPKTQAASAKSTETLPKPTGPTDVDEEEQEAAIEEFDALTDKTLEMHREEMPAYWRLLSWAEHQDISLLQKRAKKDVVFNDFIQSPDKYRGQLVALKLNVRRILGDDPGKNPLGLKRIYEVWGFTTESQAWLYVGVTGHIPEGMPIGPTIEEQVTFYGYFLKLQGYHEAGARPNARPLIAPVLVGKMVWRPSDFAHLRGQGQGLGDWLWILLVGGGIVILWGVRFMLGFLRGSKRRGLSERSWALPAVPVDEWLDRGGTHVSDGKSDASSLADGNGSSNGHGPPRAY